MKSSEIILEPIISYPKEAEAGNTYLMTVDLRQSLGEWQYDEEEYVIYCLLDTMPLFSNEPVGEPAVVLHRFGGTYGPASFLLTAAQEEMEGTIRINLVNGWGMPIRVITLDDVSVVLKGRREKVLKGVISPVPIDKNHQKKSSREKVKKVVNEVKPKASVKDYPNLDGSYTPLVAHSDETEKIKAVVGNKYALLVGTGEYTDSTFKKLSTPPKNVEGLRTLLTDGEIAGFEVETLINKGYDTVRNAIIRFYEGKSNNDLLLFYFSGHGIRDSENNLYFTVRDTSFENIEEKGIPAAFINDLILKSRSKRHILILDHSHSGAYPSIKKHGKSKTVVVLTASDAIEFAWEAEESLGNLEHSVFTHHLIQGIKTGKADSNKDRVISTDELYDYICKQMTASKQKPLKLFPFGRQGDVIFARVPRDDFLRWYKRNEKAHKKIFVLYGRVSYFENAVSGLNEYIQSQKNTLYFQLDMLRIKRETFPDTLFEIIHQLGDQIPEKISDPSIKIKWYDTLQLFRKVRDAKFDFPDDDKQAEFVSFADTIFYPDLKDILHHLGPAIVSFRGFELLENWSQKTYNFLLRRLIEKVGISALLFVCDEYKPNLFYGSDESSVPDYITFHKLEGETIKKVTPKPPVSEDNIANKEKENIMNRAADAEKFLNEFLVLMQKNAFKDVYLEAGSLRDEFTQLLAQLRANTDSFKESRRNAERNRRNIVFQGYYDAKLNLERILADIQNSWNETYSLKLTEGMDILKQKVESGEIQLKEGESKKTFLEKWGDIRKKLEIPLQVGEMAGKYTEFIGPGLTALLSMF